MSKRKTLPGGTNWSQISDPGLQRADGLIFDETVRELQGPKAFQAYREIADNSSIAGACLFAIETLIRKAKWRVVPGDDSADERERAEIVGTMFDDMASTWPDTVSEILSMNVYGFAPMEIVYKVRKGPDETDKRFNSRFSDGLVGWRKFVLVPQETLYRWVWDDEAAIKALVQQSMTDRGGVSYPVIPEEKLLLFRTKTYRNNPEGRSMLRTAYFAWQFLKRIMEVEGIGIERDLAGLPVAYVPPEIMASDASASDRAMMTAMKSLVVNLRRNSQEGVVFPMAFDDENNPMYELKLLATSGMRQFDTNKIIERYERRIAMSMLADVIMMGHEKGGSLALSKDKTTLIGRAMSSLLAQICAVFNRVAIPRLYKLNAWNLEAPAKLEAGDLETHDLKILGNYIKNLVGVGALTPDPGLESTLREAAGLPALDPDFALGPNQVPTPPVDENEDDEDDPKPGDEDEGDNEDDPAPDEQADEPKSKGKQKKHDGPLADIIAAATERRAKRASRAKRKR